MRIAMITMLKQLVMFHYLILHIAEQIIHLLYKKSQNIKAPVSNNYWA